MFYLFCLLRVCYKCPERDFTNVLKNGHHINSEMFHSTTLESHTFLTTTIHPSLLHIVAQDVKMQLNLSHAINQNSEQYLRLNLDPSPLCLTSDQ